MRVLLLNLFAFLLPGFCFSQQAFTKAMMANPREYSKDFENVFVYKEVPVYTRNAHEKSVYLKNGYASSVLQQPVYWPLKNKSYHVKEVRIIFTKYPVDKSFWSTNYYDLLAARLQAAFTLDPGLNDVRVIYTLVLQTACKTDDEAKQMMHAIEIVYEPGERKTEEIEEPDFIDSLNINNTDSLAWIRDMNKANRFFKKSKAVDTVVLKGLHHFKITDSLLVVIDVTGSMAPYYSQVSLWAARNFYPGHYYVLFNDAGDRSLPLGKTGGYADGRVRSVGELIKFMRMASAIKGKNKEFAENDVEGILAGIASFPDNRGIVLVADNVACIRDYKLLGNITQPVHIIPCGGNLLNPQYLNMAWFTGGSVFWNNETIDDWTRLCNGQVFLLGDTQYRFRKSKQRFEALNEQGAHLSFCDFYTTSLKKKK